MKPKRKILYVLSDIHSGYKFGLCNPETVLPDGMDGYYNPELSKVQQFLWQDVYQQGLRKLKEIAGKDEIIFLFVGDMTHGNKHTGEQMTTRAADQKILAYYNFLPILELPNVSTAKFAVGTAAHNFGEGSSDYLVSMMLKEKFPKKNISATYHARLQVNDVWIDMAHHGPGTGGYWWTKGNSARQYLRDRMFSDINAGVVPADLYLRGHYHDYIKEYMRMKVLHQECESFLMVCPPMCMPGDWTRQAISSLSRVSVGGLIVEISQTGRRYEAHQFTENFDLRISEVL